MGKALDPERAHRLALAVLVAWNDLALRVSAQRSGRTSPAAHLPRRAHAKLAVRADVRLPRGGWGRVTEAASLPSKVRPLRRASEALLQNRSSKLQLIAAELRSSLTPSEAALWRLIRGCRLGVWFRRQAVVGRFIVDFVAPSARLAVEVDGGYHALRRSADARRDRALARLGYRVLRLEADLVIKRSEQAVALIHATLSAPP